MTNSVSDNIAGAFEIVGEKAQGRSQKHRTELIEARAVQLGMNDGREDRLLLEFGGRACVRLKEALLLERIFEERPDPAFFAVLTHL